MITALLALFGCVVWDALIVLEGLAEVHASQDGHNAKRLCLLALAVGLVSIVALHTVVIGFTAVNITAWVCGGAAGTLIGVYLDRRHHGR